LWTTFTRADAAQHNHHSPSTPPSTTRHVSNDLYTSITGGCDNLAAAGGSKLSLPTGVSCDSGGTQYA